MSRERRRLAAHRGAVMDSAVRRADVAEVELRDREGVLVELVGVEADGHGRAAVLLLGVADRRGHDLDRRIPGDRLLGAGHFHHRELQPVIGRPVGRPDTLGVGAAAGRVVAVVDHAVFVRNDGDVVVLAIGAADDVEHRRRDPLSGEGSDRVVGAEGVAGGIGRAVGSRGGPDVALVATADDAVLATHGVDFGVFRGQGNGIPRRHGYFASLANRLAG